MPANASRFDYYSPPRLSRSLLDYLLMNFVAGIFEFCLDYLFSRVLIRLQMFAHTYANDAVSLCVDIA